MDNTRFTNPTALQDNNFHNNQTTNLSYESNNSVFFSEVTRTYMLSESTFSGYEVNSTTTYDYEYFYNPFKEDYVWLGACILMGLIGFVLNVFVLLVVSYGDNISKEVKIQVINLAIADILMSVLETVTEAIYYLNLPFPNNIALCKIYRFVRRIAAYISLLICTVISVERFVIFFFPFKVSRYTKTRKCVAMAVTWACATLVAIRPVVDAEVVLNGPDRYKCVVYYSLILTEVGNIWLVSLQYIVPSLVIITLYTLIFIKMSFPRTSNLRCHSSSQKKKELGNVSLAS